MPDLQSQLNEQKRKVDFNTYDMSLKELVSMIQTALLIYHQTINVNFAGVTTVNLGL